MPKREKFIDYGKALMIVLVVMVNAGISNLNNISHILMSYFFMVSGYCYTKGKYKYINRNRKITGFYSGFSLAYRLGISTQVPFKEEITSNFAPAVVREVEIGKRKYILRRPFITINNENKYVLQFLECLKDLEKTSELDMKECGKILKKYAEKHGVTKAMIDKYIGYYPIKVLCQFMTRR